MNCGDTVVMSKLYYYFLCAYCLSFGFCATDLPEGSSCIGFKGFQGRCVLYKRCYSLIQDRQEGARSEICSYQGRDPVVCCTDCDLVEDIDKIVIDPQAGVRYKDGSKSWDYCLTSYQNLPYRCKQHFSFTLFREWNDSRQCHDVRFTAVGAAGGEDATRGEFPHMALLGYGADPDSAQWLCAGSLISDRFILTAAHCTSSPKLGSVTYATLGILRRSDPRDLWQIYAVQSIIVHPEYKSPVKYNDIALLKTQERVKFSTDVLPACVHSRDTTWSGFDWASAMGWGKLGDERELADTLQKVVVQRFSPEECGQLYKPYRLLLRGYDHSTQMCFGHRTEVKDTCEGDSGGPLVTANGCMYDVYGVTSYGRACGFAGRAGMYTRVLPYVPWIESHVWP